jgi:hypothetical protein
VAPMCPDCEDVLICGAHVPWILRKFLTCGSHVRRVEEEEPAKKKSRITDRLGPRIG